LKIFIDATLFIYLNTITSSTRSIYERFYFDLIDNHELYTDALMLDETIFVSKRKYHVPYNVSIKFIEANVLPYVLVLSLGEEEYREAAKLISDYGIKPSDALHVAVMLNNNIELIATEDKEFDKIREVKRLWIR